MTFGSLFSGIGGLDLGLERAGWTCRWQSEIDSFCSRVLKRHWPHVMNYGDITKINGKELPEVDLLCGEFPCQDVSQAGKRLKGIEGNRSGLWKEYARIVYELQPKFVLIENVKGLYKRGLSVVLEDLAKIGYDAEWTCLSSCRFGAPHTRERVFIIAYPNKIRRGSGGDSTEEILLRWPNWKTTSGKTKWSEMELWIRENFSLCYRSTTASELQRVDSWFPQRLDRCGAVGNAVDPIVAEWLGRRLLEVARDVRQATPES